MLTVSKKAEKVYDGFEPKCPGNVPVAEGRSDSVLVLIQVRMEIWEVFTDQA